MRNIMIFWRSFRRSFWRSRKFQASILSGLLLLAPVPVAEAARTKPGRPLRMKPIQVKAGTLRGVIKGYTGKPVAKATLELVDTKGKVVAKTVTKSRGEYVLKDIPPGRYTAVIGGTVRLPISMTREATVSRLMIVPRYAGDVAGPPKKEEGFLGLTTWTWVLIGGGVAIAVAIPLAAGGGGGGGGGGGPVSP